MTTVRCRVTLVSTNLLVLHTAARDDHSNSDLITSIHDLSCPHVRHFTSRVRACCPSVGEVTNTQLMEVLTRLSHFTERQEAINADLLSKQEQFRSYMELQRSGSDSDSSVAADDSEEKTVSSEVEDNEEKKRQVVRNSRKSVTLLNDNNGTLYTGDMLSPTGPPPTKKQTEAERERRQSRLFHTPASLHKTPASAVKPKTSMSLPAVDKSRHSKYYEANSALSKIDKFYGDRKNDKDIDVYTFVRSVDFQLDRWMEDEPFGRLELVISVQAERHRCGC